MSTRDVLLPGDLLLRLVDVPAALASGLEREVGPFRRPAADDDGSGIPDVTLRVVERLPHPAAGTWRTLNRDFAAYDDERFVLFDAAGRRTQLPIERFGEPIEILCERGVDHVPLLRDALALRLLATGRLLLHSSAFRLAGTTVLAMGWQKGGKSELLLASMAEGASFVSDEWTVVDPASRTIAGFGDRLFVWDWHLEQLPELRRRLRKRRRLRLTALRGFRAVTAALSGRMPGRLRSGRIGRLARLATPGGIASLAQVQPAPAELFGDRRLATATIDVAVLAAVGGSTTTIESIDPAEVARRMVFSQASERRGLLEAYAAFRHAFPDRPNTLLETATDGELKLLTRALDGLPAFELVHPYPVALRDLSAALGGALRGRELERPDGR